MEAESEDNYDSGDDYIPDDFSSDDYYSDSGSDQWNNPPNKVMNIIAKLNINSHFFHLKIFLRFSFSYKAIFWMEKFPNIVL